MLYCLSSDLNHQKLPLNLPMNSEFFDTHQVVIILSGGTEAKFLQLVRNGLINLNETIYLFSSGINNSLAASLEILSWINLNEGHGEIRIDWQAE